MGYNRQQTKMKRLLSLLACMMMVLGIYADNNSGSSSCKVDEIPGAYIYATVSASGDRYIVKVTSYGLKEGTVEVAFDWEKEGESQHETVLVHFSNGKGEVDRGYFTENSYISPTVTNVRVYNPICRTSNQY